MWPCSRGADRAQDSCACRVDITIAELSVGALQEPWIGYLLTFHVFLLTAAILKRRSQAVTAAIFFLSSGSRALQPAALNQIAVHEL